MERTITINCGRGVYLTIGNKYISVSSGKTGSPSAVLAESLTRLMRLALNKGATMDDIADELEGLRDREPWWFEGVQYLSIPDAVAKTIRALKRGDLS